MLKHLNRRDLNRLLAQLNTEYRLQVPQCFGDGTRQLAPYAGEELSLSGPRPQRKPTAFFFPQTQMLLRIAQDGVSEIPQAAGKHLAPLAPLALVGLDRADLAGIAFLDRFFMAAPADDVYVRNRQQALLVGLTGAAGPDNSFLPLANGACDIELIAVRGAWLALGHSEVGQQHLADFPPGDLNQLATLRQLSAAADPLEPLYRASLLLREDRVPDEFWAEIADRCILCSGCNLACPTCSCFCVQDRQRSLGTDRSRVWDSCQLDAFMREASGHNPLGTETLRTRRRIQHKLATDVERWGEIGCVACGRCDRACPTGIGILAVSAEIVKRYGLAEPSASHPPMD